MLGAFGAGAEVSAQRVAFAGSLGAHLAQQAISVRADSFRFRLGGVGGGLRAYGVLLSLPRGGLGLGCHLAGLAPPGFGRAGAGLSVGLSLGDDGVPFGLRGRDPRVGVRAGLRHSGVPLGPGGGGALLGGLCAGLGRGQMLTHLLGGGISLDAELVGPGRALLSSGGAGLGSAGALVGCGADGFHPASAAVGSARVSIRSRSPVLIAATRSASARSDRSSSVPVTLAMVTGLPSSAGLIVVPDF